MPRFALLCAAAALLVVVATCGDPTAPSDTLTIQLRAQHVSGPHIDTGSNRPPQITCQFQLVVMPSNGDTATWTGGKFAFFVGRDTGRFLVDLDLSASEVSSVFGSPSIRGDTIIAALEAFADVPFRIHVELRYRLQRNGQERTAETDFRCGAIPSGGPPTITALTVTPATGPLELGDSLAVTYSVSAPAGLWHAVVTVPIGCGGDFVQRHNEGGRVNVTRTVYVRPPSGVCPIGTHITTVQLAITDAALETATMQATVDVHAVDTKPPRILLDSLVGDVFAGDTLRYIHWLTDNSVIRKITWEVLGTDARDSINLALGSFNLAIPVRAEWGPTFQLRLYAEDIGGNSSELVSPPGGMRLRPTVSRAADSIALDDGYWDFIVDERRNLVYLLSAYRPTLRVVSMSPLQIVDNVALPKIATSFDLTASGDSLLVTGFGTSLGIVDLTTAGRSLTLREVPGLNASVDEQLDFVRVAANGHAILRTRAVISQLRPSLDLDLVSWAMQRIQIGDVSGVPGLKERSGDGRRMVFLTDGATRTLSVFDPMAGTMGPGRTLPPETSYRIDYTGERLAIGLDVYDASFNRISTSPLIAGRVTLLTPDGATLWQLGSLGSPWTVRSRTVDGTVLDRTRLGVGPVSRFTRDGSKLVTLVGASSVSTTLKIVDAR